MSFIGSGNKSIGGNFDGNVRINEADEWSEYPATQNVDIGGFNLDNVNNITIAGEIDLEDLVLDNLTVNEDLYVSGTSFLHGVEALDAISVVSPSVANKFSMEYSESVGIPKMTLTSDGGTPREYIRLSDVPSGLIQLLTPSEVDADMTITTGGLYATDDGVYAGEGTGGSAFNAGLECDPVSSTGRIVLKSGVATNPIIDFTTSDITMYKTIQQTTGTATLKDTTVDNLTTTNGSFVKLNSSDGTETLTMNLLKVSQKQGDNRKLLRQNVGVNSSIIPLRDQSDVWIPIGGGVAETYQIGTTNDTELLIFINDVSGITTDITLRIFEPQDNVASGVNAIPQRHKIMIHRISGDYRLFLELCDKDGNLSVAQKYGYLDMSSGTIVGRDVVNKNPAPFSIYTAVHSMDIVQVGKSPYTIRYYVEYK